MHWKASTPADLLKRFKGKKHLLEREMEFKPCYFGTVFYWPDERENTGCRITYQQLVNLLLFQCVGSVHLLLFECVGSVHLLLCQCVGSVHLLLCQCVGSVLYTSCSVSVLVLFCTPPALSVCGFCTPSDVVYYICLGLYNFIRVKMVCQKESCTGVIITSGISNYVYEKVPFKSKKPIKSTVGLRSNCICRCACCRVTSF